MEDKWVATNLFWIVVGIVIVIGAFLGNNAWNNYLFVKGGYTMGTVPGGCDPTWIKPQ